MPRSALEGSRIRERRGLLGLRQADVARSIGVSPAYLNLIEHNRRRVGPELLHALARALSTDVAALTEGGEAALLNGLRAAAAQGAPVEFDRLEEFAGRFPGWAGLVAAQNRRIAALERTVEVLNDRLAHDPFLSTLLHELLSAITSIRSAASILAETGDLDAEWQARFHANLRSDSERLSSAAGSLARHLDASPRDDPARVAPLEELEAWLDANPGLAGALEAGQAPADLVAGAGLGPAARMLAERHLTRAAAEARLLPRETLVALWAERPDPVALAARLGADLSAVLRRVAALAGDDDPRGIVACDASGTLTFRRAIPGLALPRFAPACALWPLFRALGRPGEPVRALVEMPGRLAPRFVIWAAGRRDWPAGMGGPEVAEATMLILPSHDREGEAEPIGTSCGICPRPDCAARREPSILLDPA